MKILLLTYVVEVSFHMNESQGLLQEENQQSRGYLVGIKFVIVHIRFLSESKRSVIESYKRKDPVSLSPIGTGQPRV